MLSLNDSLSMKTLLNSFSKKNQVLSKHLLQELVFSKLSIFVNKTQN